MFEGEEYRGHKDIPPTNLEGKGYLKFPQPLGEEVIEKGMELMRGMTVTGQNELEAFKKSRLEYENERKAAEDASTCLKIFSDIIEIIEKHVGHPGDVEAVLSDPVFFRDFSKFVRDIKEFKVIEFYEDYIRTSNAQIGLNAGNEVFLELCKEALLRAELYLASQAK